MCQSPDTIRVGLKNLPDVEAFVGGDLDFRAGVGVVVATPQGALVVQLGDYIVRNTDGTYRREPHTWKD